MARSKLLGLIRDCDVFMTNMPEAFLRRHGLTRQVLAVEHPRLVQSAPTRSSVCLSACVLACVG